MRKIAISIIMAAAMPVAVMGQGYENPVIPGFHPDPSVCAVGEKFYLVNSSFQYFPGVPIYESDDMAHWHQIGNVLDRESQLPLSGTSSWLGIYAPTIRYNKGVFYMITTNVPAGGNFLVTATDPAGPWSEPVMLSQGGIDPSLYFEDGDCYMVSNPNGITLCKIDPKTGEQLTESKVIWNGTGGRYPEGPHIYKKDGYYYLLISEGGTELAHSLTIARSEEIWGPYTPNPKNPILTHCRMAAQDNQIQATGHGDLVQAGDGSWWIVFLAYRNFGGSYHHLGRETYLAPVEWNEGEWPVVNGNNPVMLSMEDVDLPSVGTDYEGRYVNTAAEGFSSMGPEWVYIQNPDSSKYELEGNGMRLYCSESSISGNERPTFLGRRQESPNITVTASADVCGLESGDEAGLTVYQINNGHIDIGVRRLGDGSLEAVRRVTVKSLVREDVLSHPTGDEVTLRIESDGNNYVMSISEDGGEFVKAYPIECSLVSTEVVGGFTGVTLGMYATGSGSAYFDYFDYKE